ncbi:MULTISPECIES: YkyA family protein [unclassified Sporosarcina]|uniref:YkyA family protein n=1 Tax=unclassified Sporosarcina TaxID=2647733 RepID=UPI000C16E8AD|nr:MULTISPECIES: YkyA family protein [unclassified Sporosarcina]PID06720.1 hypothetical protein CSV66_02140 [Sporosarcina sp. P30]PID09914.1 hypothetical protein CSV65_02140 [Sporosarcina sp. P31]PID13492.1 hypothetical protein CSV64_00175 [Sporosarcina sp. P32b]
MKKVICLLFILLLLIGCSKESEVTQQLTDFLVVMNEKEKQGNNFGRKLFEKEQKEQILFIETIELTQQQYQEVKQRVVAMKKSARERALLIEKEESASRESKKAIDQMSEWMEQVDLTDHVGEVVEALYERSEIHENFILQYKKLIDSQTQLYTQIEDQSIRERELQNHVSEVNDLISSSQQLLTEFNEATREVNRLATRAVKSLEKQ